MTWRTTWLHLTTWLDHSTPFLFSRRTPVITSTYIIYKLITVSSIAKELEWQIDLPYQWLQKWRTIITYDKKHDSIAPRLKQQPLLSTWVTWQTLTMTMTAKYGPVDDEPTDPDAKAQSPLFANRPRIMLCISRKIVSFPSWSSDMLSSGYGTPKFYQPALQPCISRNLAAFSICYHYRC